MSLIPVENHSELFRDSRTGAIVNKSTSDFERYNNTRNKMLSKEERINHLEQKVDNLSSCLLYTSPSPRDISGSRMPSSA